MLYLNKTYILIIVLALFLSCRTTDHNTDDHITDLSTDISLIIQKPDEYFTPTVYLFRCQPEITGNRDPDGFGLIKYSFYIGFANYKPEYRFSFRILADDGTVLSQGTDLSLHSGNQGGYFYSVDSITPFVHTAFLLDISIKSGDNIVIEEKNARLSGMPGINSVFIGPIVNQFVRGRINTSLSLNIDLQSITTLDYIRLIPPDQSSYWDIPFAVGENGRVRGNGVVTANLDSNYINNGNYILQIKMGDQGLFQRNLIIADIFGNTTGKNYGFPVPVVKNITRDIIELELRYKDIIKTMEILIYDVNNNFIAIYTPQNISDRINKREMRENLVDQNGQKYSVTLNQRYMARVVLKTEPYNNIGYISITDYFPLTFEGFRFFWSN